MKKIFIACLAFVFSLGLVLPAQAFYLEVPQSLKVLRAPKKIQSAVILTQTAENSSGNVEPIRLAPPMTQEGGGGTPAPSIEPAPAPKPQTCNLRGIEVPGPCSSYGVEEPKAAPPEVQQYQQPTGERQDECAPGTDCKGRGEKQFDRGNEKQFEQGGEGQPNQNDERMKKQQEQDMQRMKRDVKRMETNVLQFERMLSSAEKKGTTISQEIKDKLAKLKSIIDAVKNASTSEELGSAGMEEIGNLMQELEEYRRETVEAAQRMQDMKRGMQGMERGLLMFEKQIAKLTKQGTVVPSEIADTLGKIKTIVAAVKAAKTWEEMESAGIEELQDLMQSLDESRQQLEILSRWPQTIKQLNQEITRLERELKRTKGVVDRLAKKNMNLSDIHNQFAEAVARLKAVRDEATQRMKDGNSEGAFEILENDFFGQMEDVWQYSQTINMMSNLGRFASEFKRGIAQSKSTIKNLARKKIDTAELSNIVAQAEAKGNEVLELLKSSPIDQEAIMNGMQELDDLRQLFENAVAELTGQEEMMPWEKGNQQFKPMGLPATVQRAIPQKPKQEQEAPQCAPGTVCDGSGTVNP